jgi:hypothetical protein
MPARVPLRSGNTGWSADCAVDRRAAGGIGNHQPIAEQLREQLDVGGFATTLAGAGELKERFQQLNVFHLPMR